MVQAQHPHLFTLCGLWEGSAAGDIMAVSSDTLVHPNLFEPI